MRPVRGLLWVLGLSIAQPIAAQVPAAPPEAASSKNKPKVAIDTAAHSPRPAQLETPPWAADDAKPAPRAPGKSAPQTAKAAGPADDKPAKPAPQTSKATPVAGRKTKGKRASTAESELASAQPAADAPPPPPPAAAPKPPAPQPLAAPKAPAAGPNCSIEEPEQPRGGRLDVLGGGFGQAPVVRIAQRPARMIERRNDRIAVQIPPDSDGGVVTLQSEGLSTSCGNLVIIGKNR